MTGPRMVLTALIVGGLAIVISIIALTAISKLLPAGKGAVVGAQKPHPRPLLVPIGKGVVVVVPRNPR
jgi:hypothetical protein